MIRFRLPNPALFPVVLSFLVIFLSGCESNLTRGRVPIRGKVTLDGTPVDGGSIVFLPVGGPDLKGIANIEKGLYAPERVRCPGPGKHRVEIYWSKTTDKEIRSTDPPNKMYETIQLIPSKYNSNSTLTVEIPSGGGTFDFDLKSK